MVCSLCGTQMEDLPPMSGTTTINDVVVGLALTVHKSARVVDGNADIKEVIPIGAFVCPKCGKVELQLTPQELSKFMKYKHT